MNNWQRVTIRYVILWLIGTLGVVILLVPLARAHKVQTEIAGAEQMLRSGQPQEALARLRRVELWAGLYPRLSQRLACASIRCQARLQDLASAETLAKDFLGRYGRGRRPSLTLLESLQTFPDGVIDSALAPHDAADTSGWLGYEVLLSELRQAGALEPMDQLAGKILAGNPGNVAAGKARDFVIRKKEEEEARKIAAAAPPPPPPVEAVKVEPPKKRIDHVALARKHIAARQWDKALEECDAALSVDPKDARVAALKRTAAVRDMKWGHTRSIAKAYDESGKPLRDLPVGTRVEVSGTRSSPSIGDLAVCRVITESGDEPGLLVGMTALDLVMGPLSDATDDQKALMQRHATVLAEIDHLKVEQAKANMKNNPFRPAYDAALAAYNAYWAQLKNLQDKHKAATGEARVKLADDMKQMKLDGGDVRVGQALENAKKQMTDWQAKAAPAATTNPAIKPLQEELAKLQSQINAPDTGP